VLVALGVSGGIAAYKAAEIVRGLTKAGAEVQVLMTANAARFVTPLTLQTLSGRRALVDPFDPDAEEAVQHVDLARRAAVLGVAPATANTLARFAHGLAEDLLSTFYIAFTRPVVVAPAMNTRMWLHPATQRNLALLKSRGVRVVDPESGWLAERESGWGRLAEPDRIVAATLEAARTGEQLSGKKVVVSAGPTREPIDPVRFVTNRSSGRMGYALAAAAARRGARVVLVSGPVDLPVPFGVERVSVLTGEEMRRAILEAREGATAIFMAAAVCDWVPRAAPSKIKKSGDRLTLTLEEGPDILAELGRNRQGEILVGFAAETDRVLEHARAKLARKGVDFLVANDVSRAGVGLEADRNAATILDARGGARDLPEASKGEIAEAILDTVFGTPAS
jgi:phosphopantothenoylcysteine decarboxylase/phosphopantothenate--cysteine ligase